LALALLVGPILVGLAAEAAAEKRTRLRINPESLVVPDTKGGMTTGVLPLEGSDSERLRQAAVQWRRDVEAGNTDEADALLPQMQRLLNSDGVQGRSTVLGGLVAMGRDWMLGSNFDEAERAFKAALYLEPGYAPAVRAQAELSWKRDSDAIGVTGGLVVAAKSELRSRAGRVAAGSRFALLFLVAFVVATAGYSLVLLVKYNRLLRHGLEERLADRVPEGIDRVIGWVLVFLPVLLFLSPPWWVVYWLVVMGGYGARNERLLALASLLIVALLPPAFNVVSWFSALPQDPVFRAVSAIETKDVTPALAQSFERLAGETGDEQAAFLLARLEQSMGRTNRALEIYKSIIAQNPRNGRALVNRGNVHFDRGDVGRAVGDYKLATDQDRKLTLAWRNGSIAYAQQLDTDTSSEWMRKAQGIDRDSVEYWRSTAGPQHVVDAELSDEEVRSLVRASHGEPLPGVTRALMNPLSLAAAVGFLFSVVRLKKGGGPLEASACEKCGRAFCVHCHAGARGSAYCTQCTHLYVKKDGVSPEVRTAKLREVERYVAINSLAIRLFNLLLPGSGGLYAGRVLVGGLLLVAWSLAICALVLPPMLVTNADRMGVFDQSIVFGVQLLGLLAVYLVALVQSLRH
jgi:tetratricopeptide (TPR) repeat protein